MELMTCPVCGGNGYVEYVEGYGYALDARTYWCDPCAGHGTVESTTDYEMEMM